MNLNFINSVKENGVVGAGGAGFPTHVKLNAKAEYIVVNGAECEPLLRVDQLLMVDETQKILEALDYIVKSSGAKKAFIGLKEKYKEAINSLDSKIDSFENMEIKKLGNFYPAGDEQVLVYETTGRIVPEGGIPLNVGVIVINVETLLNVYNSMNEESVTEKYITVTGNVKDPQTVKVPIGVSIKEVIDLAGGTSLDEYKVINGGPMMGKIVKDIKEPVTKTTKGLIVLPIDHSLVQTFDKSIGNMLREAKTACMHCSLCSEVCPRNLIGHNMKPDKLMRLASYGSTCEENLSATTAYLCCECRLCQYACIMDLQPWKLHQMLKEEFISKGINNNNNNKPEKVQDFREYKKYPVNKLIRQLGIKEYDAKAPFNNIKTDYSKVEILLRQHIGAPAVPIVEKGQKVKKGQKIAKIMENTLGANLHASIEGIIDSISDSSIVISNV
jgi:Na+-translocating ferredoxin:NAD+ oxidoreductase RnfC subunit